MIAVVSHVGFLLSFVMFPGSLTLDQRHNCWREAAMASVKCHAELEFLIAFFLKMVPVYKTRRKPTWCVFIFANEFTYKLDRSCEQCRKTEE